MKMWVEPDLFIPANDPEVVVEECLNFAPFPMNYIGIQDCSLPEDWSILGILPHCHLIGQSWEVYAETPEGETLPIIKIPDWDFNWQGFYYPEYMQHIPQGSTIKGICIYDNSSDNPLNPNNPPQNMGWGELTTNEMFFCPIYYVPYQEGDENIYLGLEEETALIEHPSVIVSIFPNPSLDYIDINFNLEQNDYLKCYLYDCTGRLLNVIFDENFKLGANSIKLDVAALSTGTYFVNIQSNKETVTQSFIKE